MELFLALITFVFVSTITPGPNNFLLATSGMRFGLRPTIPHVLGIHVGLYSLVMLCGIGLGQLLLSFPASLLLLKLAGSGYLLYLAWKIIGFRLDEEKSGSNQEKPMTTWQAGLFQFSNPKAWMMAMTGLNIALPLGGSMTTAVVYLCLGFATLGQLCNWLWVSLGYAVRDLLNSRMGRLWINGVLSVLTLSTVVMIWMA